MQFLDLSLLTERVRKQSGSLTRDVDVKSRVLGLSCEISFCMASATSKVNCSRASAHLIAWPSYAACTVQVKCGKACDRPVFRSPSPDSPPCCCSSYHCPCRCCAAGCVASIPLGLDDGHRQHMMLAMCDHSFRTRLHRHPNLSPPQSASLVKDHTRMESAEHSAKIYATIRSAITSRVTR